MAEIKNIPELRFPEFTGKWNQKKFGELYTFKPTNSFSRDMLNYESGSLKNIHYGDIHTKFNLLFDIDKENVPFVNSDIKITGIADDYYVQEGDLILADASEDYNDIGKSIEIVNLNKEKVVSGLHTILSRQKTEELTIGFMAFLMKTYKVRLEIMRIAQGTKVLGLSSKRLAEIPLWIPQKNEQDKIATFLTAIDKRISLLNQQKEQLERYKKGLMQKIFSRELRFKDENGEGFPEWEEKKLGAIGKFYVGGDLDKLDYQKERNGKYIYPIFSNGVGEGLYGYATTFQYNSNCVTVSGRGNLGYANARTQKFNAIVRLIVIEPKDYISSKFLEKAINNLNFAIESTGVPQLTVPQISNYKINIPTLSEQVRIANFLSTTDNLINQINSQIDKMNVFKRGLLQKLFV